MQRHKLDILEHIEASAPCSLFSVGAWAHEQFGMSALGFSAIMETLVESRYITVNSVEDSEGNTSLIVELI